MDQVNNINTMSFLKSKENYKKLKEKIKEGIREELIGLNSDFKSNFAQNLIKKIIPDKKSVITEMDSSYEKDSSHEKDSSSENIQKKHTKLISKNMKGDVYAFQGEENKVKSIS